MKARRQWSHITHKTFLVDELVEKYEEITLPRKKKRLRWFKKCFPPFLDTEVASCGLEYCAYILENQRRPESRSAHRYARRVMIEDHRIMRDIAKNGLRKPLDFYVLNGQLILIRGYRRLFTLKKLGYKKVQARVFKNLDLFNKLAPPTSSTGRLEQIAEQQFMRHTDRATDKYWVHSYLPLYERHVGTPKKILEVGVFYSGSAMLWHEAFPEAELHGLDLEHKKPTVPVPMLRYTGDQTDAAKWAEIAKGGPFDLIIDDASHKPDLTWATFLLAWDSVAPGGWYVVEDTWYNYRDRTKVGRTMEGLKSLVDEMNRRCEIEEMHFYYNIVFVKKR